MGEQSAKGSVTETWKFIKPEDCIDICWPAKGPLKGKEEEHLNSIEAAFNEYGWRNIQLHRAYLNSSASFGQYYSNTNQIRSECLKMLIEDESCKVIWAGAGGFGSAEVLDIFENTGFSLSGRPIRPIIGFSDITALHLLAAKNRWPSLHASVAGLIRETFPVTKSAVNKDTSIQPILQILQGEIQELNYKFKVLNPDVISNACIETSIIGGNLSVVQRSQGSPTALNGSNRTIFLEDTGEDFNREMSLLTSLARAGTFDKAHAIIFGDLPISGMETQKVIEEFERIILKENRGLRIPVLYSDEFGHDRINNVLPFGTVAKITFSGKGEALLNVHVNESAYEGRCTCTDF